MSSLDFRVGCRRIASHRRARSAAESSSRKAENPEPSQRCTAPERPPAYRAATESPASVGLSILKCSERGRREGGSPDHVAVMSEHLASWHDTATRAAIVEFVERVTTEGGPDYVPPSERIAVYDNDGTLWCEKPMPIELGFILVRLAEMAEAGRVAAHAAALAGRVRQGLRLARRGDQQALPRRRRRPGRPDGRHAPGLRRPERRALLARRRRLPARRQASDARPHLPRVRLRCR